jgi:hypothetical protein
MVRSTTEGVKMISKDFNILLEDEATFGEIFYLKDIININNSTLHGIFKCSNVMYSYYSEEKDNDSLYLEEDDIAEVELDVLIDLDKKIVKSSRIYKCNFHKLVNYKVYSILEKYYDSNEMNGAMLKVCID